MKSGQKKRENAEEFAERVAKELRAVADHILNDAQKQADRILNDAQKSANPILSEAQRQAKEYRKIASMFDRRRN